MMATTQSFPEILKILEKHWFWSLRWKLFDENQDGDDEGSNPSPGINTFIRFEMDTVILPEGRITVLQKSKYKIATNVDYV